VKEFKNLSIEDHNSKYQMMESLLDALLLGSPCDVKESHGSYAPNRMMEEGSKNKRKQ